MEEDRFAESFRAESRDRLARLEQGLLALESDPRDAALLDRMFRDAHNLKGGARMLGLRELQEAAHAFEDVLGMARGGERVLAQEDIQRLFEQLDQLRRLLDAAAPQAPPPPEPPAPPRDRAEAPPDGSAPEWAALPPALPSEPHRLESIRIPPERLDALMRRAVELNTARLRLSRRPRDLERSEQRLSAILRETMRSDVSAATQEKLAALMDELSTLRRNVAEDATRLDSASRALEEGIRDARLVPMDALFDLLPRLVRDVAKEQGKAVRLQTEGGDAHADKAVLDQLRDPLMHLVRNAIDHGLEPPSVRARAGKPAVARVIVSARQSGAGLHLEVRDDGRGLDEQKLREAAVRAGHRTREQVDALSPEEARQLLFLPGVTTREDATDVSGRGVGMDVVRSNVERLKGRIEVVSAPGEGTAFRLRIPVTLLTALILVVEVAGRPYGLPIDAVEATRRVRSEELASLRGAPIIETPRGPVPVVDLEDLLELPASAERRAAAIARERAPRPCVVLTSGDERFGVLVDGLRGEEEALVRPLTPPLERVRNVAGTTLLGTGEVCTVLDVPDLLKSIRDERHARARRSMGVHSGKTVLLVEDSIMTRTYEQRILEEAGYSVVTAVDGVDAWNKLQSQPFDAVVTDIEMPRMDGYLLTERIRRENAMRALPIVMVTAHESETHRRRGLAAGANAYVEKPTFTQTRLLDTLRELIG